MKIVSKLIALGLVLSTAFAFSQVRKVELPKPPQPLPPAHIQIVSLGVARGPRLIEPIRAVRLPDYVRSPRMSTQVQWVQVKNGGLYYAFAGTR